MKKIVPIAIALVVVVAFGWTLKFLYDKSQDKPVVYETRQPKTSDIVKKTVATGSIVPRQEVALVPRVSGILEELYVEAGTYVKAGDPIAKIKIVPNVVNLNSAESRVKEAQISFDNARKEKDRNQTLLAQGVISEIEYSRFELDFNLRQQELSAAQSNLQLIKSGAAKGSDKVSNVVTATVEGMVIEVPQKVGASVTEANNFNAGTTIASVADMNDMIFEGLVDESEVGKLKEGMPLEIVIGAIEGQMFKGTLEYISPKGVVQEGAIQFEIRAALLQSAGETGEHRAKVFVRAGYSANADIVLERRDGVLAIDEALIQYERDGTAFVEVETAPQVFEKRPVQTGLSDGMLAEVLGGVAEADKLKVPQRGGPPPARKGGK